MQHHAAHPLGILLCGLFLTVGCTLLGFALWIGARSAAIVGTHEKASGVVTECERIGPEIPKGNMYTVQVRYDGPRGGVTASAAHSSVKYEVGESVTVYYRPETSYKVVLGTFSSLWLAPTVAGLAGMILVGYGVRVAFILVAGPATGAPQQARR